MGGGFHHHADDAYHAAPCTQIQGSLNIIQYAGAFKNRFKPNTGHFLKNKCIQVVSQGIDYHVCTELKPYRPFVLDWLTESYRAKALELEQTHKSEANGTAPQHQCRATAFS